MTIEEIKEIRATVLPTEQEYFDAHGVEMVDFLLDEVERLNDCKGCDAPRQLAVAAEALEKIKATEKDDWVATQIISSAALERINVHGNL